MSTRTPTSSLPPPERFMRLAGLTSAVGALVLVATSIIDAIDGELQPVDPGFGLEGTVDTIAFLMLLVAVIGLARSQAGGDGWLARLGLRAAGAGLLVFAVSSVPQLRLVPDSAMPYHVAGTMLIGLGMIAAGSAVLRARRWRGWQRSVPLLVGLYPFVVLIPLSAILGNADYYSIGGMWASWLAIGAALWTTRSRTAVLKAQ